jgi:hypothetical protein
MKTKKISERGQAIIIITLAAIGLFAIGGLAIDGSAKFSDRRNAQNAADTAALAGALSLVDGNTDVVNGTIEWKLAALDRALDNGYNNDLVSNTVEVYRCDEDESSCGPYAGKPEYVQVIINSNINTYFARVIGVNQTHNRVQAVTYWNKRGPNYDGSLIVALNPNPCSGGGADGNLVLGTSGGSTGVINLVGGGAFVNSGGSGCGMNLTGCPTVTITGGTIGSTGTGNIDLDNSSGTCSANVTAPTPSYGHDPYPFPPDMPDVPDECTSPAGTYHTNANGTATIVTPGRWNEFPPSGRDVQDHVIMEPGTYCVNDMVKLNDQQLHLTGVDVTIFIRDGYKFDITGGEIDLDAPATGPYAGYLIIVDSDFSGSALNCTINGNGLNSYVGTIFAPYCNVTINGTSDPTSYSAQLIAYTVKLNGSAAVNLYYNAGDQAKSQPKVGLMR